jgi:hypothetical protein
MRPKRFNLLDLLYLMDDLKISEWKQKRKEVLERYSLSQDDVKALRAALAKGRFRIV